MPAKDFGKFFNVAHIEQDSFIYGPGKRFVIWLQGCSLACNGCWNKAMWSFSAKELIHREDLLKEIVGYKDIDGITILGGEPLHQAENVLWLANAVRNQTSLNVFLFTGYERCELERMGLLDQMLKIFDILVIGRYVQSYRDTTKKWIGSSNQEILYPKGSRCPRETLEGEQVEIVIEESGSIRVLGFPDPGFVSDILQHK